MASKNQIKKALKDGLVCPVCRLNPNGQQDDEQQEWETEYILDVGVCSACISEYENNIPDENTPIIEKYLKNK